eukprot:270231_1
MAAESYSENKFKSYIIYLLLPQKCNTMQLQISAISDEYLPMKLISKMFPYLWYCAIKTSTFMKPASHIRFSGDNDKIIIKPKLKFKRTEHAYYHIEEDTTLFGMFNQNQKTQENKAAQRILAHLISIVKNWKTYEYARIMLESLDDVIIVHANDFLWIKTKENMMQKDEIKCFLQYLLLFEAG